MQLFSIVFMVAVAAAAAQLNPKFDQNFNQDSSQDFNQDFSQDFYQDFNQNSNSDFKQNQNFGRDVNQQQQPIFSIEQPEVILLNQNFDQDLAGNYEYSYELNNGQKAEQTGRVQPGLQPETGSLEQKGSYEYVGDDGKTYRLTYTANEGGFQPGESPLLPTAPPQIPEYEQLRQEHPELFWAEPGGAGIYQQKFSQ